MIGASERSVPSPCCSRSRRGPTSSVASGGKSDFVRGLRAKDVIDYRREGIDARGGGYDVVLDIAGNRPVPSPVPVLAPKGAAGHRRRRERQALLGGQGRQVPWARLLGRLTGQRMTGMLARPNAAALEELARRPPGRGACLSSPAATPSTRPARRSTTSGAGRITGKAVVVP